MRRRRIVVFALLVAASAALASASSGAVARDAKRVTHAIVPAPPFSVADLVAYGGNDWLTTGGGLTDARYSTLTQINRTNVANLGIAWHGHLGLTAEQQAALSEEAAFVAYQGTLYVSDGQSDVYAIDGTTGALLWTHKPTLDAAPLITANRGVTIGDGKVFSAQVDGNITALDQQTGAVLWKTKIGDPSDGESFSSAPVYYNGMVIDGASGGDWAGKSYAVALDARTGAELWRWNVIPKAGEAGFGTWPKKGKSYGGAIWIYPSIDPQLNLVYLVTGNPVPWNGRGPGDNKWTDSIVALNISNGKLAWGFQTVHHDIWDYDVTNPPVLFDATVNGAQRHGLAVASKTGWVYILDRATGEPLLGIPEKKVPQYKKGSAQAKYANLAKTQPYPNGDAFVEQCSTRADWPKKAPDGKLYRVGCIFTPYAVAKSGSFLGSRPSAEGGVDWPPPAFDPTQNYIYLCVRESVGTGLGAVPVNQQQIVPGQLSLGVNFGAAPVPDTGLVVAMDVTTNKVVWKAPWPSPCFSGVQATAGGLVFAGQSLDAASPGTLTAFNSTTGETLWNSPTLAAGPNAPSISYMAGGKQYVAILAGGGGFGASKAGDDVYGFALP